MHAQPLAVVLGLRRGAVIVAAEVARVLTGELDVLLVKKLRTPGNSELALGAINADGSVFLNHAVIAMVGGDPEYLDREIVLRRAEMQSYEDFTQTSDSEVINALRSDLVLANLP